MKKSTRELAFCTSFLLLFYLLIRYPLFFIHGMKDWPLFMFFLAALSMLVFWFMDKRKMIFPGALFYILSFIAARFFSSKSLDLGGGKLDSTWKLWLIFYLLALILYLLWNNKAFLGDRNVSRKSKKLP